MKFELLTVAAMGLVIGTGAALAQDQDRDQTRARDQDRVQTRDQDRTRDQERLRAQDQIRDRDIYGYQMMTAQERNTYRTRMRAANTQAERERIRAEHHAQMQARAHERGVTLPPQPGMGGPEVPMPGSGPHGGGMGGRMGGGMRR